MNALIGVAIALVVIAGAVRMARAQGVAAGPLLGWSLLLGLVVATIAVAGSLTAFRLLHAPAAQLTVIFATVVVSVIVGIWLSRRVWNHLQPRANAPRKPDRS